MKIKKIQLKNIGPYVDYNGFDFDIADSVKRMVLVGGKKVNGARRWFELFGVTFQPSEIAKIGVILFDALLICRFKEKMGTFKYGVVPFAIVAGVIVGLLVLEPHLSASIIILAITAVMMFIGGTRLFWFLGGLGLVGIGGFAAINLLSYSSDRITAWLDPFADPLGDGHQTIQSLYAIGSGGAAGVGLGNSRQKYLYVPEPQNDFIFSILCEELGFIGAACVMLLFLLLLVRGMIIAARTADRFGALLVVGFVAQVVLQAVLNIAVVTNTIPNTGISLPFFSSGGTSLMMLLGEMGIVLSVSRSGTQRRG